MWNRLRAVSDKSLVLRLLQSVHYCSISVVQSAMATKKDEAYYLVKWDVKDFSVIPESYFSPGSDLSVACYNQATKGYATNARAQILKISGKCTGDR